MKRKWPPKNTLRCTLSAISVNESVCRQIIGAFLAAENPTVEELADVKCAVSEAVTNCIVHAYKNGEGLIYITVTLYEHGVCVVVRDKGCGIADVKRAREPLFTTDAENERSGMGFTVMENFMDRLIVRSRPGEGTVVMMSKRFGTEAEEA